MTQIRYAPINDADASMFTPSTGSIWSCIDDDPASPNLTDYLTQSGVVTQFDTLPVGISPPTIGSETVQVRTYDFCTGNPGDVAITEVQLLDATATVAASYSGTFNLGTSATLRKIPLTYTPGSYNWSAATLRIKYTWYATSDLTIYAADLLVGNDPNVAGPGGQRAAQATHHQMLCGL